ncbi:redoxin domain-containing protein [Micromonospora sp. NPDC003197]
MTQTALGSRSSRRRWLTVFGTLLCVGALGLTLAVGLHRSPSGEADADRGPVTRTPGTAAPALAGRTLDDGHFDLAKLPDRVVLVNVFASWCAPCRAELPLLVEAQRRWSGQGLQLVGLAVRDSDEATRSLLRETGAEDLLVLADPTGGTAVDWGARGVPETFVIDRTGRVVHWAQGQITRQWLEQRVAPLLAT